MDIMHVWGEEDFDWAGLDQAIDYIDKSFRRIKINVRQSKEKYGTARIYCSLGWSSLLSITHPGYMHYRPYPKWLMTFDIYYGSRIIPFCFNWFIVPFHKYMYRRIYQNAVNKWPHLKDEIVCMADYNELLKGI